MEKLDIKRRKPLLAYIIGASFSGFLGEFWFWFGGGGGSVVCLLVCFTQEDDHLRGAEAVFNFRSFIMKVGSDNLNKITFVFRSH